jgi:DNA-binding transcriptional MerR regulator
MTPLETDVEQKDCFAEPALLDEPQSLELFQENSLGITRLYTVAMMADVLGVSQATIRHWRRNKLIQATRSSSSIDWYDYSTLVIAKDLSRLLRSGLSLRELSNQIHLFTNGDDRRVGEVISQIVIDGRRLSLRWNDHLLSPGGQMQLDFYACDGDADTNHNAPQHVKQTTTLPVVLSFDAAQPDILIEIPHESVAAIPSSTELLDIAADLEAAGNFIEASEALRAVLQSGGPCASITFMLAETLYRAGDLAAARERYYTVIELDEDHLEARTSLACILAEQGDPELATAALEGVLKQQPDYADAHWHLAGIQAEAGYEEKACFHLHRFLALAPESPWASLAREQLSKH